MIIIKSLILDNNKKITSISNLNIVSSTLVNLSVKNCSIGESLEKDSLNGIPNLKHADFSLNNLTQVNAFSLDKLHNLETLNLSHNKIEILKNYCFSSSYNLVELDLRSNEIFQIELHAFVNLTKLKILDLAENDLEVISESYTSDLKSLEKINLENNKIKRIIAGSFSTCMHLKELFLQGNAFDCSICEDTKYVVELLNNDTLFKRDADAITCELPEELEGTPLTNVSFDTLEDYCSEDYFDSTTNITSTTETAIDFIPTSTVPNGTENILTPISSTLTEKTDSTSLASIAETIPSLITNSTAETSTQTITESLDITSKITTLVSENTTEITDTTSPSPSESSNVTTEFRPMGITESEVTERNEAHTTTEINTITESTSLSSAAIPELKTMSWIERNSTEENDTSITTEKTTLFISEHTTEELARTIQSSPELTSLSTTETDITEVGNSFNKSVSTLMVDTNETDGTTVAQSSSTPSTSTESLTVSTNITETDFTSPFMTVSTLAHLGSTDMLDYSEYTKAPTTSTLASKKISDSQLVRIKDYNVSDANICVRWDLKWEILNKQWMTNKLRCSVEIHHSGGKEFDDFKKCPTNDHEIHECLDFENKYLNNMYKFCLNVYITPINKLKACSKYHSLSTTEKPYTHSSTSDISLNSVPTTEEAFVPFKVLHFDVIFNYSNSFAIANWIVTKNERNSICSLHLILMSHNFNYTEGVFSCKNNSYKLQNIKQHETFQVCLRNFYRGYYAPLLCQSSVALSYEFRASSMKDDGYKNSALIAVICLLLLILLIVIVLLVKKILKKRNVSDLYNVSAEEKNVLRRTSASVQREPCVRYSYTLKEQMEI